jgi:hypothetical protein
MIAILFIKLMMGHALADFALQSDAMAKGKNRNRVIDPSSIPVGQKMQVSWFYWLTSHALIHGMLVWLITGSISLGVLESVCHWLIDFGKCDNKYGIHMDQFLHALCKLMWCIL